MSSKTRYRKTLPKNVIYRGDGIWDDIVSGGKWLFDKGKQIYKWVKDVRPLSKINTAIDMIPGGNLFVNEIPFVGPSLRQGIRYGAEQGWGMKKTVKRKATKTKKGKK
jgi:hypothetical protein